MRRGDETCIGILFRNLIDNAIRYSPAGGEVEVTVRKCGLFNRIIVTDNGSGIPDGQHDEMFQRFRRGAEPKMTGSGLGLSIVRRICELHGGSVHLENREEGGLRCEVRLPPTCRGCLPYFHHGGQRAASTPRCSDLVDGRLKVLKGPR